MQEAVDTGGNVAVVEVERDMILLLSEADLEVKARIQVELRRLARWETMSTQKGLRFIGNNTTKNFI